MSDKLLVIKDLVVEVGENMVSPVQNRVVKGVDLEIGKGEIVVITGANGSGKSSLANTLLGSDQFAVISGQVRIQGEDLLKMSVDARSRAGLYLAYQNPVEVPGVKIFTMCKVMYESHGNKIASVVEFRNKLEKLAERVGLTKEHVARDVNTGFSGGEKKRLELLQLLLLHPKLVILDEIDSGLDVGGREMVRGVIEEMRNEGTAFLIITHYDEWLKKMNITKTLVMSDGQLQVK